jgi:energy-coupling factor transporter ATP-binding protein EcfA2
VTAAAPAPSAVEAVPVVPWADFLPRLNWRQGEHVALVGPTGQGKTTLALALLPRRQYRVIVATKPRDATLSQLARQGYVTVREWPPPVLPERVILWPRWRGPEDTLHQARVIRDALDAMFAAGGWSVMADDVQYLTDMLALGRTLRLLWLQARAIRVSVLAATQRPTRVPREMWDQSTHLFLWQTANETELRALSGMSGANTRLIRSVVEALPQHHALYVNARTGAMCVTKAPRGGVTA